MPKEKRGDGQRAPEPTCHHPSGMGWQPQPTTPSFYTGAADPDSGPHAYKKTPSLLALISTVFLKSLIFTLISFVDICGHINATVGMQRSEDNLRTLVLSFPHVGTGSQTQVVRLGSRCLPLPAESSPSPKKAKGNGKEKINTSRKWQLAKISWDKLPTDWRN